MCGRLSCSGGSGGVVATGLDGFYGFDVVFRRISPTDSYTNSLSSFFFFFETSEHEATSLSNLIQKRRSPRNRELRLMFKC